MKALREIIGCKLLGIMLLDYYVIKRRIASQKGMRIRANVLTLIDECGFVVMDELTNEEKVAVDILRERKLVHGKMDASGKIFVTRTCEFIKVKIIDTPANGDGDGTKSK